MSKITSKSLKMRSLLTTVLMLGFSSLALANSQTIGLDGNAKSFGVVLNSQVTHTEYRTESYIGTCTERRYVGREQRCERTEPRRECHDVPGQGRVCGIVPGTGGQRCWWEDRYDWYSYSCEKFRQVPFEVFDYSIQNEVEIQTEDLSQLGGLNEVLTLSQNGEAFRVDAVSTTGKVLIYQTGSSQTQSFNGSVKLVKTLLQIKTVDRLKLVSPALGGMTDLVLEGDALTFTVGNVISDQNIQIYADMRKVKLFGDDEKYLMRDLLRSEYELENQADGRTKVRIDLNKVGLKQKASGQKVKFDIHFRLLVEQAGLLNTKDLPALSMQKTDKIRL